MTRNSILSVSLISVTTSQSHSQASLLNHSSMMLAVLFSVMFMCLVGCEPSRPIQVLVTANKPPLYAKQIKKVYVIASIPAISRQQDFAKCFEKSIIRKFSERNIDVKVSMVSRLELYMKAHVKKAVKYMPDAILRISGRAVRSRSWIKYDLKLLEIESQKIIWRARIDFTHGWKDSLRFPDYIQFGEEASDVLAQTIIERLVEDGLIR